MPQSPSSTDRELASLKQEIDDINSRQRKQAQTIEELQAQRRGLAGAIAERTGMSRREVLNLTSAAGAGMAGAAIGGVGAMSAIEPAAAKPTAVGDVGTKAEPANVFADDLEIGAKEAQFAVDGYVVPCGTGLGVEDAVDPATTSTPVQDATDAVSTAGGGTVLLPPTTISEGSTWNPKDEVSVRGLGRTVSVIEFDGSVSPLVQNSSSVTGATYSDFGIRGNGIGHTTTAINHGAQFISCNFQRLRIRSFHGIAINVPAGVPSYQNRYESILFGNYDAGDVSATIVYGNAGAASAFDSCEYYPNDTTSGNDSNIYDFTGGKVVSLQGYQNVGGWVGRFGNFGGARASLSGIINIEPDGQNTTAAQAFYVPGNTTFDALGATVTLGGGYLCSDVFTLNTFGGQNIKRTFLPDVEQVSATVSDDVVAVDADVTGDCVYRGSSSDVSNNTGGALSQGVACLADLSTVT